MSYEIDYDEDGRPEEVYVKEEPDCGACCDRGCPECWPASASRAVEYTPEGKIKC